MVYPEIDQLAGSLNSRSQVEKIANYVDNAENPS